MGDNQTLMFMEAQLVRQKQDERLSHETMLSFCATAELVATGKLVKYCEYYEHKYNKKNLGELSLELAVKLECIRTSYQIFQKDYGYYNFPENLTKEELIEDVNYWINCLRIQNSSQNLIQLYQNFLALINGLKVPKANHSEFIKYGKIQKNTMEECNDFAFALMKEGKKSEKIMDEVENQIMQTGTSKTYAKINRNNDYDNDFK